MAVAGNPESRHGIILAKNELARKRGVKTAETIGQAKMKCPELALAPPHHEKYEEFSKAANEIYSQYTDLVEPFGIDESWLDVTGVLHLFGDGEKIADDLRKRIRSELGITISVGVSFNKVFAKLGSDCKKPDATTSITEKNFREIVYPLSVEALLFVGKASKAILGSMGIFTIGDLARSDKAIISKSLGKVGEACHDYANGIDHSPVTPAHLGKGMKSIGNSLTFRRNLVGFDDILSAVSYLADETSSRMRKSGVKCKTVSIAVRSPDFINISRQKTLETPTNMMKEIRDVGMGIMKESWNLKNPIRMLAVTGANLIGELDGAAQISLFEDQVNREKRVKIEAAMDAMRGKYGKKAFSLGISAVKDLGLDE
jgi:DNA polymerase-4